MTTAEKKAILLSAGFEAPSHRRGDPFRNHWFAPRRFCPELDAALSLVHAWARYLSHGNSR